MLHLTRFLIKIPVKGEKFLLAINGLTGSVDVFYGKTKDFMENFGRRKFEDPQKFLGREIFLYLKSKKYLLTPSEEQLLCEKRVKKIRRRYQSLKRIFVSINPTEACNLACPYCINALNRAKVVSTSMNPSQVRQIFSVLDILTKKRGLKIAEKSIRMLGGEPLLLANRPAIEEIAKECKERGLKLDITTNGTFVFEYLDLFKQYPDVFNHFQLTLDGSRDVHNRRRKTKTGVGYFDRIVKSIDLLLGMKKSVTLRSNFDNSNIKYLSKMARLIKQRGWEKQRNFNFRPHAVTENYTGNPDSRWRLFSRPEFLKKVSKIIAKNPRTCSVINSVDFMAEPEELLLRTVFPKKVPFRFFPSLVACATAGASSFTFAADNKIYACNASVGLKEFCLGEYYPKFKLYPDSIKLWKNRLADKIPQCRKCRFLFLCGGNCPLRVFKASGKIYGVEKSWCEEMQACLDATAEILKYPIKRAISKRLKSA